MTDKSRRTLRRDKSPRRHSPEKVKSALAKIASGRPLIEVARELGVSKGLLSYWKSHSSTPVPSDKHALLQSKLDRQSRTFIDQCWKSIHLAFRKLDSELKKEKPHGIRDLALAIAVIKDKLNQTIQDQRIQIPPDKSGWSISEDTWMILRQHKEAKTAKPPPEKVIETDLATSGVEQQKKDEDGPTKPDGEAPGEPQTAQHVGDGVD